MTRDRLEAVQVLRALAASAVVLFHATYEASRLRGGGFVFAAGGAGVDLFFIISGFVMIYATERGPAPTWRGFMAGRIARIVPLYWATTSLFVVLALAVPSLTRREIDGGYIAASFLFWPAADQDGVPNPFLGLGWTLNYEMMFYALFAFALWTGRDRIAVVGAVFAAALAARAALTLPVPLAFWADPIILEFAAGMALARLHLSGARLGKGWGGALVAAGAILIVASPVPVLHRAFGWGVPAALLFAGAVLAGWNVRGPLGRALVVLGGASYALYLTHWFVLGGLRAAAPRIGLDRHPGLFVAAALATSVVVALLVWVAFEKPATALVKSLLLGRTRRAGAKPPVSLQPR